MTLSALVVSNLGADARHPERGSFVRDQVTALQTLPDLDVQLHEFGPGPSALASAALQLRRRFGRRRFDVVHAHFGLTAWPSLAVRARARVLTLHGTDVRHPRTRAITRAALPRMDLVAAVSQSLAAELPASRRPPVVLPCGVDTGRFRPLPRSDARRQLGLSPQDPLVLFPADPERPGKRHDLALQAAGDTRLIALDGVQPAQVPLWVNAANAVLVPSDAEGFGLAVLEALACDVPVLATPVGIHPVALEGIDGCLCAPFDAARWRAALTPHLKAADPRVDGRHRAQLFSAHTLAERVAQAWRALLSGPEAGVFREHDG